MRATTFVLGAVAGGVAVLLLRGGSTASCCDRVRSGFRERVADALGEGAANLADRLGITNASPALLDALGVS